jgi:putative ABC transport system permease protein
MKSFNIKLAIRNLLRNKFYSLINIAGLAIGITACILILLYVKSEFSYDKFHKKADQIYRVNLNAVLSDNEFYTPTTSVPLAETMQAELPEVEEATRILDFDKPVIKHNNILHNETKWYYTDANFFNVFSATFIFGNEAGVLSQPNSLVLTETTSKKYFGNENPVGKYLTKENDADYLVTAVIKDFPQNSHIKPNFLASLSGQEIAKSLRWTNNMLYTYFLLREGYTATDINASLEQLVEKYIGPEVKQSMGISFDDFKAQGAKYQWYAQSIKDIHFDNKLMTDLEPSGNRSYMVIFSIIAAFILLIASINFMNLSTARSANRAKEVGIRKSMGSNKKLLISQFLGESILVTLISLVLTVILIKLLLSGFNNLIEKQLTFHLLDNFKTIPLLLIFGIFVGIVAGSYPAFFLASFNPVKVIKGIQKSEGTNARLRNGLVIFQLAVSIILFSGTFIIGKQLHFLQNKELGFNKENLVVIQNVENLKSNISSFKNELLAQSGISAATNTSAIPGRFHTGSTFSYLSVNDLRGFLTLWTDEDFLKTFEVEMVEGRYFDSKIPSNNKTVVLNESAVKKLNIKDAVGQKIYEGEHTEDAGYTIIGIMKDFHSESLHKEISSIIVREGVENAPFGNNLVVRVTTENMQQNLKHLEQTWNKFAKGQAFDYVFFDEDFGRLYNTEVRTKKIVAIFSALAIVIACLGLLALAAFIAEQRTKEIGVRKVNGARVSEILFSLNSGFIKWVGIAFVIAVPVAWYVLHNWLRNFAYKTDLSWWIFALAGLLALGIALLTVSFQSWKAATRNPVESLRYE